MINNLFVYILKAIIWLRYNVRITGLDDIEKKGKKYFFSHDIDMTEQKKERYISRIMTDNHFVKNLSIKGESVSIIFDKNTSEDEINQTLLYCSRVFNFESYKLIK